MLNKRSLSLIVMLIAYTTIPLIAKPEVEVIDTPAPQRNEAYDNLVTELNTATRELQNLAQVVDMICNRKKTLPNNPSMQEIKDLLDMFCYETNADLQTAAQSPHHVNYIGKSHNSNVLKNCSRSRHLINKITELQEKKTALQKENEKKALHTPTIMVTAKPEQCWFIRPWDNRSSYNADDSCFVSPEESPITNVKQTTTKWLVLVNMHRNIPLIWSGYIPKGDSRSYNWAVPFHIAHQQLKNPEAVHNLSALPLEWSQKQYRNMVSFIFIPPQTEVQFKVGFAKEQPDSFNFRSGHGVQVRLYEIPKQTVIITQPLITKQQKATQKGLKRIDLLDSLRTALKLFSTKLPEIVPSEASIMDNWYSTIEEFVDSL